MASSSKKLKTIFDFDTDHLMINSTYVNDEKSDIFNDSKLNCPICLELMESPTFGKCKHTFCLNCINKQLNLNRICPVCNAFLHEDKLFCNKSITELIRKRKIFESTAHFNGTELNLLHLKNKSLQNIIDAKKPFVFKLIQNRLKCKLETIKNEIEIIKHVKSSLLPKEEICVTQKASNSIATVNLSEQEVSFKISKSKPQVEIQTKIIPNEKNNLESINLKCVHNKHLSSFKESILQDYKVLNVNETANRFRTTFDDLVKYSNVQYVKGFHIDNEVISNLAIVPSLEVDSTQTLLCAADTAKNINVYKIDHLINDVDNINIKPICRLTDNSNLSTLYWNQFGCYLLSGDRDGCICNWDIDKNKRVQKFFEHQGRCWSICSSYVVNNLAASGGDDGQLKIWDMRLRYSALTLTVPTKVLCARFHPVKDNELLSGQSNSLMSIYDLRKFSSSAYEIKAHNKAVSYAKYLTDGKEIVTSSNDATMKLWQHNTDNQIDLVRNFTPRSNKKELCFTGLSCNKDMIACGTERNSVLIYKKNYENYWLNYQRADPKFEHGITVCSVAWHNETNRLFTADHTSFLRVLKLQT